MSYDDILMDCSKTPSDATPRKKRKQETRSPRCVETLNIQWASSEKQSSLEIVTPAPASTKQRDTPVTKRLRLVPKSPELPPRPSEKSPELPSQSSDIAEEYVLYL